MLPTPRLHFVWLCTALLALPAVGGPAPARAVPLELQIAADPDDSPHDAPDVPRGVLDPWLADLRRDAEVMAAGLVDAGETPGDLRHELRRPVTLHLLPDFAVQARRVGRLGVAVAHDDGLHLVLRPADLAADTPLVHHELARLLIRRAGWDLPPALEDGAALWLSGGLSGQGLSGQGLSGHDAWYGRPWRAWLGDLAAMGILPTADELLAAERPRDASDVLWTPVAAAVVDALPGDTLAAKLDPVPSQGAGRRPTEETAKRVLAQLASPDAPPAFTPARPPASRPAPPHEAARPAATVAARYHGPFQNGVAFAMVNAVDAGYHAPAAEARLDALLRLGVDAVSVMPFAYQRDPARPGLAFLNRRPASETDVGVVHAARRARERGMTVLWKPHLWIGHHSWPGDVAMTTEDHWRRWFRDYRRYVVHHAVLAEHAEAEWFAVGVELGKTVHREAEWRRLIAAVRTVYSGRVTYAGNWWGDYDRVPFWDALDAVGVDAYFPLAPEEQADLATLRAGARDAVHALRAAAERWNRPVLLTEVGFAARRGAWASPHEEGGELSEADQRLAWQVLLAELGKPPWLLGLHAWKVFTHPHGEGRPGGPPSRPDFRWVGRPAQTVLEAYYRSEPGDLRIDLTGQ